MSDKDKKPKQEKKQQVRQDMADQAAFVDRTIKEASLLEEPTFGISKREPELGLGERLQTARESKRLTQGELAELTKLADPEETGISRAVISMYEVGKNRPSPRELRILCEVLHISPNLLIYGEEDPFNDWDERHRWGGFASTDSEFNALLAYSFHELHHHHKLAILQLINGLLWSGGKGGVSAQPDKANDYFLKMAEELKGLLEEKKSIKE